MLEISNAGVGNYQGIWQNLTVAESRTHFGLWCLLKSPLLLGCNLLSLRPDVLEIIRNPHAIALNQDPLGVQVSMPDGDDLKQIYFLNKKYVLIGCTNFS